MPGKKRPGNPFANPLETTEQTMSRNLLKAVGFIVCCLDQARATQQTPGLYDTYAIHPGIGVAVWLDSKRKKKSRVSPEQEEFVAVHEAATMAAERSGYTFGCGIPATIIGSYDACERFVARVGLGYYTDSGQFIAKPVLCDAFHQWVAVVRREKEKRKLKKTRKKLRSITPNGGK